MDMHKASVAPITFATELLAIVANNSNTSGEIN